MTKPQNSFAGLRLSYLMGIMNHLNSCVSCFGVDERLKLLGIHYYRYLVYTQAPGEASSEVPVPSGDMLFHLFCSYSVFLCLHPFFFVGIMGNDE